LGEYVEGFFKKEVECPICKNKFDVLVVRHGSYEIEKRDSDFCIYYKGVNPLHYSVWVCSNCGYAALSNEFEKLNVKHAKNLVEACKKNIDDPNKVDFSGIRTTEATIESYKRAIECDELSGVSSGTLAGLYLRIAWLYREQGETGKEQEYMKKALSFYEDTFEHSRELPSKLGTVGVAYLIGELNRRLGDSKEAVKWFNIAISHPEAKMRKDIEKLARAQWQLAREGYLEEKEKEEKTILFMGKFFNESSISALSSFLREHDNSKGVVEEFEKALEEYLGCKHVFALSSGGAALLVVLLAFDVKDGDEVIASAFDFWWPASTILALGAQPVFVDIDSKTFCVDPLKLREKIGARTKTILVTDYAGYPHDFELIQKVAKETNLPVIENAQFSVGAELNGKKVGNISDVTCFDLSFLSTLSVGRGGLIATNDDVLAEKIGLLKNCGFKGTTSGWIEEAKGIGFDLAMSSMQAVVGLNQLKELDMRIDQKNARVKLFNDALSKLSEFKPQITSSGIKSSWAFYPLKLGDRLARIGNRTVAKALNERELEAMVPPTPPFLQPPCQQLGFETGSYPVAEEASKKIVLLPFHSKMTQNNVERTVFLLQEIAKVLR